MSITPKQKDSTACLHPLSARHYWSRYDEGTSWVFGEACGACGQGDVLGAKAKEVHQEWQEHIDECASCRYFPKGCATGNRLDELATMWERQLEA